MTRGIGIDVNIERRRGTASFGIFTHHAHASDEGVDTEGWSGQDEVVSCLVVERGHRRLELLRADTDRRFRCWVVILIPQDEAGRKFRRWQSVRLTVAIARNDGKLRRALDSTLPFDTSLREREWNHPDG